MSTDALFAELLRRVESSSLLRRTYVPYAVHGILTCSALIFLFSLLTIVPDTAWIVVLIGIGVGMVLVQAGMLGHDFSHLQVFDSVRLNRACAVVMWSLVCGLSERGWYEKHNAHHKHVNHLGEDPDLGIPFAFSPSQISTFSPFVQRFVIPHQHWLFFIALPFVYPNFVLWSFLNIFTNRDLRSVVEGILLVVHFTLFFGIPLLFLPVHLALLFCVVAAAVGGIYMGMVFAPNHKGEDIVVGGETTWRHQIELTRNIYSNRFMFLLFGGLDLQIEHHLFPCMSRYRYPEAQQIVKDFCRENNIRYYETTWWGSLGEIYRALYEVSCIHKAKQERR